MSKFDCARWGVMLALCLGGACGDDAKSGNSSGECAKFTACGGDLVGSWEYTDACLSDGFVPTDGPLAVLAKCDDKPVVDFDVEISGQIEFGKDGSFAMDQTTKFNGGGLRVSKACLAQVAKDMGLDELTCDDVEGTSVSGGCRIAFDDDAEDSALKASGTYTVSGKELSVQADGQPAGQESTPSPYCVRGDTLQARVTVGDTGLSVIYTAKRK
jgi:hypothetical protein